jgi:hypothetical protein
MKPGSFDFEVSDGLNEAGKETFKVAVRKPELTIYDGRVPLPVFPFTQVSVKPENLLVRSSDARDVLFQVRAHLICAVTTCTRKVYGFVVAVYFNIKGRNIETLNIQTD